MKNISLSILFFAMNTTWGFAQVDFDRFFKDKTMRFDYHHFGNATSESAELDSIYAYGIWAGSKLNLINEFDYGESLYKIMDEETGQIIFSRGFDSYFKEYQTTEKAIAGATKSFFETALFPYPLNPFIFILEKRGGSNQFEEVYRKEINPATDVSDLPLNDKTVKVISSLNNGLPENKVDILIIGDGYTANEFQKFEDDLERSTANFFEVEPLKSHKEKFNIRGIFKPSQDSGVTESGAETVKKTAVNLAFGALGQDRYLLTEDLKSVHDIAAYAPADAIVIMANSDKYGGGGIYNFYSTFSSDHASSAFLLVHEFGHSFFGLGDEYYSSSTAYNDFYPEGTEPRAPNITAGTDKETLKWKHLLTEPIDVPTHWEKASYDSSQAAWQAAGKVLRAEIAELIKTNAPAVHIKAKQHEYDLKSITQQNFERSVLTDTKYAGKVGVFEGAGYASEGLYRPAITCIMLTREEHFCPVCEDAIVKMINWVTHH